MRGRLDKETTLSPPNNKSFFDYFFYKKSNASAASGYCYEIGGKIMRLDKYLKVSRLIKRRTVANEVCDAKHVTVNGKIARASYDVKVGDIIEIQMGENLLKAQVLIVTEHATKNDAGLMYKII